MPETPRLLLAVLSDEFAVCRLSAEDAIPAWAHHPGFCAITRTAEELSVVCPAKAVPAQVRAERDWRILKVAGPLDFALTGILVSLATPLADAGISVFAVSTFDKDYLLVRSGAFEQAIAVLSNAGHTVGEEEQTPNP